MCPVFVEFSVEHCFTYECVLFLLSSVWNIASHMNVSCLGEFSVAQCFTYVSDNFWQVQHAITLPFCGPAFGESNKPSSSPTINKEKITKLNTKEKTYSSENMRVCFLSTFVTSF